MFLCTAGINLFVAFSTGINVELMHALWMARLTLRLACGRQLPMRGEEEPHILVRKSYAFKICERCCGAMVFNVAFLTGIQRIEKTVHA